MALPYLATCAPDNGMALWTKRSRLEWIWTSRRCFRFSICNITWANLFVALYHCCRLFVVQDGYVYLQYLCTASVFYVIGVLDAQFIGENRSPLLPVVFDSLFWFFLQRLSNLTRPKKVPLQVHDIYILYFFVPSKSWFHLLLTIPRTSVSNQTLVQKSWNELRIPLACTLYIVKIFLLIDNQFRKLDAKRTKNNEMYNPLWLTAGWQKFQEVNITVQ